MLGSTFLRLRRPLFFVLAAGSVVACTRGDAGPGDPGATGKTDEAPSAESFRFPLDDWSSEGGYVFGSPWLGTDGFHTGVDMHTVGGSAAGDPVHAAANGVVHGYISAAPWGDAALVRHEVPGEGTVYTQYWHVNRGDNVGMRVAKGQVFTSLYDLAGTSEGRYGNHVHFAVWVGEFADATWSGHLPSPDYPGRTFPDGFVEPVDYVNRHGGGASPSSDDCGGLTYQGECVGSTVRWCEGGVREVDCSATGEVCAWESDAIGYNCVPAPPAPWCGDGTCNGGEGCGTCARDCGACPPECGDGTCNGGEDCGTCPGDCGACPPECGDGTCNGSEDCGTCARDCGTCCGDGACEAGRGETCATCPADCDCPPGPCDDPARWASWTECAGDVLRWCGATGSLYEMDCTASGDECRFVVDHHYCVTPDPCADSSAWGRWGECLGDIARWCGATGTLWEVDCGASGMGCSDGGCV